MFYVLNSLGIPKNIMWGISNSQELIQIGEENSEWKYSHQQWDSAAREDLPSRWCSLTSSAQVCASPFSETVEHFQRHEPPVAATALNILESNEEILVVDKPSSIPVHPCGRYRHNSVLFILAKENGINGLHCRLWKLFLKMFLTLAQQYIGLIDWLLACSSLPNLLT